jgi:hypothetical protein
MILLMFNDDERQGGTHRFKWEGDLNTITVEDIEMFIQDWEADILEPILKSQKPPEKQEEIVQVLVGTTHDAFAY